MIYVTSSTLNLTGSITANGNVSAVAGLGSGSGGSITIISTTILGTYWRLSALGGDSNGPWGGAGGGGRIYVEVSDNLIVLVVLD